MADEQPWGYTCRCLMHEEVDEVSQLVFNELFVEDSHDDAFDHDYPGASDCDSDPDCSDDDNLHKFL